MVCIVTVETAGVDQMAAVEGVQQQGAGESSGAVLQGS